MAEPVVVAPPSAAYPWARVLGWTALLLAAVAAVGVVGAVAYLVDGWLHPTSWGDLAGAILLTWSCVPALVALPVGLLQAHRGVGPRWRSVATVAMAAPAPALAVTILLARTVADVLA
ncbi:MULTISPECIES: hypothetical protein [Cellulomonas]|jgi:hypothetical protein|uniref:Uncharacterized protein n=2 Tax=Cellulomonas TaxID=1707 RepID=A0A401UW50_9CELL|nr:MULTISPECIES: hypothetical protein [Cellulomonas]NKY39873.1 hypothetical protein [Cellulomonas septica]GCD18909.1 hypothetical protein CTKZ_04710 [Cellulomonas algicola]